MIPVIEKWLDKQPLKKKGDLILVEPFAGGASVGLQLLMDGKIDQLWINELDEHVYTCWYHMLFNNKFTDMIRSITVNVKNYKHMKKILNGDDKWGKEHMALAYFFINRTAHSGLHNSGPIGGYDQSGNYKIDCRFNKDKLIQRIENIKKWRGHIRLTNKDGAQLIKEINNTMRHANIVFYVDPPYYTQGKVCYRSHFNENNHKVLADVLSDVKLPWLLSYDDCPEIRALYKGWAKTKRVELNYSNTHKRQYEVLIQRDV